jgi:DNA polymerase-3 subunit delta'
VTHPREAFDYRAGQGIEEAFLLALGRGRLHHAWLLTGPEGVGKATFAYRAARRLLGAKPSPQRGPLGADPDDPVSRQVTARSHPDLLVLERWTDEGKPRRNIPVDEARQLPEFFAKSPASAPYRVAIIDAADDLNANAANAVLKTLEEPPPRGVLFLISHAPGKLLPTIRSRCRRLAFPAWPIDQAAAFVAERAGVSLDDAQQLSKMAAGAPGKALALAGQGALEVDRTAQDIVRALPKVDEARLLSLADGFRGAEGQARFNLLLERLADQVRNMTVQSAAAGETGGLDRWAQAWARISALPAEVEGINLDRADAFFAAVGELRAAASP